MSRILQEGMLCVDSTKPSVTEEDIERVFNEIDYDGNGFITPKEAKKAYKTISQRFKIEKVRQKYLELRFGTQRL